MLTSDKVKFLDFSAISTAQVSSDTDERKNIGINGRLETEANISMSSNHSNSTKNSSEKAHITINIPANQTSSNDLRNTQRFRLYELESCTV